MSTLRLGISIFTILVIIIHTLLPLFWINAFGLLNSTYNKIPFDVVISHYKEDLWWVDQFLPENCRVFIYTKSDQKPNCKRQHFHKYLPNVGRCDHTYLHHIIENYDIPQSDNILFLPGSCNLFYKKINLIMLLNNIGKREFNSCFLTNSDILNGYMKYRLDSTISNGNYCSSDVQNKHADCNIIVSQFKTLDEFKKHFGFESEFHSYLVMHSIHTKLIYNRSKGFYVSLRNSVSNGDNVLNGHFIERAWYTIFKG